LKATDATAKKSVQFTTTASEITSRVNGTKRMAMATTHVPPPRLSHYCSVAETDFESLQWTPPADFHSIMAQRRHRNIPPRTISSVGGGNHKASFATITVGTSYSTAVGWVARHQHVFYLGLSPSSLLLFVVAASLSTSAASLPFDSDGAAIAIVVVVVVIFGSRCLVSSIVAFCSRRCVSTICSVAKSGICNT
jgi:hypothetical protein